MRCEIGAAKPPARLANDRGAFLGWKAASKRIHPEPGRGNQTAIASPGWAEFAIAQNVEQLPELRAFGGIARSFLTQDCGKAVIKEHQIRLLSWFRRAAKAGVARARARGNTAHSTPSLWDINRKRGWQQLVTLAALQSGTIAGTPNNISRAGASLGLFLHSFVTAHPNLMAYSTVYVGVRVHPWPIWMRSTSAC